MRATQIMGLTAEAKEFLEKYATKIEKICPRCKQGKIKEFDREMYDSAKDMGLFGDGPDLYQYELVNGEVIKEIVQASQDYEKALGLVGNRKEKQEIQQQIKIGA